MSILTAVRASDWNKIKVYQETAAYAHEHNQEDAYKKSLSANNVCRQVIEHLMKRSPSHMISISDIEEVLIPTFGLDRIALIIAITIQYRKGVDQAARSWTEHYPVKPDLGTLDNDRNEWLVIDADPDSINVLAAYICKKLDAVQYK